MSSLAISAIMRSSPSSESSCSATMWCSRCFFSSSSCFFALQGAAAGVAAARVRGLAWRDGHSRDLLFEQLSVQLLGGIRGRVAPR